MVHPTKQNLLLLKLDPQFRPAVRRYDRYDRYDATR
jgi:hypothetical protein